MEQYELISKRGLKVTKDAEPVSLGECTGKVEVIRDCCSCEYLPSDTEPRIFLADNISQNLRPLLPIAKGFIFRSGNNLGHFSNVIRYNGIPACVSEELWCEAAKSEQKTITFRSKRIPERCAGYRDLYSAFCENIEKSKFQIPVLNAQSQFPKNLSNKILSVNQLLRLGYRVPRTALFIGTENSVIDESEILRSAPCWIASADRLMVRPSLCGGSGINRHTSGLMSSKTVSGFDELMAQLADYQQECMGLSQKFESYQLAVLIQEFIPPESNGVIFTRIPWDYSANRYILELSSKTGHWRYEQSYHSRSVKDKPEIDRIIADCLDLSDYYSIPLEVEFVVTENKDIYLLQFRPDFVE